MVTFFILVSAIILKIRSLVSLASGTEKEIDDAISQLSDMQNKIRNDLSFYTHFVKKQEGSEEIQKTPSDKVEKVASKPDTKKYIQKEEKYVNNISEPVLISQKPLSKTKGFYLVDCGSEKALIGYIKDEIFVLNKFQDSINDNIHVRFTERIGNRLIYLVKNGRYKALVQVEKENMKVLLEM